MGFFKNWQTKTLLALLLLQGVWISGHMIVHAQDGLNPWKLGGYAMYVQPKRYAIIDVYVKEEGDVQATMLENLDLSDFGRQNWDFNFYCKSISQRSLKTLFNQNPELVGKDTWLYFYVERFYKEPLRMEPEIIGKVEIKWPDDSTFNYLSKICEKSLGYKTVKYDN